jgi:uncharacterized protein YbaP (TraB family)
MKRILALIALVPLTMLAALSAQAACVGQNVFDTMPVAERAALRTATDAVPFGSGNFWTATRGDAVVHLAGTYHLDDPRHDGLMADLTPVVDAAATVLVEAGPDEEAALLDLLARDPSVVFITEGPTLLEQMAPADWQRVAGAMEARQIPAFMAAKFQPWYLSMMLSIPPCALEDMASPNGLDHRVMAAAQAAGVPVRALEPYDTLLSVFGAMSGLDQIDMIMTSLAMEPRAEDFGLTMADLYFRGENRLIWELMRAEALKLPGYTPERVAAEFALMEEALMDSRNRAWIPVIEDAATEGPVLAAFGALHLSGEAGVLNLLAQNGWTVAPWDVRQR